MHESVRTLTNYRMSLLRLLLMGAPHTRGRQVNGPADSWGPSGAKISSSGLPELAQEQSRESQGQTGANFMTGGFKASKIIFQRPARMHATVSP